MIRALFLRQLRHHAPLLAAIVFGLAMFEMFMVWVTASMDLGTDFHALLEMLLPPAMLKFVLGQFGFASAEGAVAFGFRHPLVLVAGVAFLIAVASIPAGERESGLLDLIIARPVTRTRYLAAHLLLIALAAALIPLALLAGAAAGLALFVPGSIRWTAYIAPAAAYAPLLLLVGAYTLWFAAGAQRRGTAIARAAALSFLFFWYDVLATMWDRLDGFEGATIFFYYAPVAVLSGERGVRDALVLLALAAVVTAAAFLRFRRQQL